MISGPIILGFALLVLTVLVLYGWHLYRTEKNGRLGDLRVVLSNGVDAIEEKVWSIFEEREIWHPIMEYTVEEVERGMPSLEELKGECVRRHQERRALEEVERKKLERRIIHFEKFKKNRHGR